jgi:hypothetical protein
VVGKSSRKERKKKWKSEINYLISVLTKAYQDNLRRKGKCRRHRMTQKTCSGKILIVGQRQDGDRCTLT